MSDELVVALMGVKVVYVYDLSNELVNMKLINRRFAVNTGAETLIVLSQPDIYTVFYAQNVSITFTRIKSFLIFCQG